VQRLCGRRGGAPERRTDGAVGDPRLRLLTLLGLALLALAHRPAAADGATVERRLVLMGTVLELAVTAGDRPAALAASERAVAALEAAEARLSTWREDTELARLNRAPAGVPVVVSPALRADLAAALACAADTAGAFDPTVGPLVAAWGLRSGGRVPAPAELAAARAATGFAGLRLDAGGAVRLQPAVALEEGGFGKGAGLRAAIAALAADPTVRSARLDLGGQVALLGPRAVAIAIADPWHRDRGVLELRLDGGSASTSGNGERGFTTGGVRYGHLLDPRTGRPAADFGSVTVWAADPLLADCLSTGLFVLGPEAALGWAAAHPGLEVVVVRRRAGRLAAVASPGLRGRLAPLVSDLDLDFAVADDHRNYP
jgi:thiamine biosynthesis lipoprotein